MTTSSLIRVPLAQLDRAAASLAAGHPFESGAAHGWGSGSSPYHP